MQNNQKEGLTQKATEHKVDEGMIYKSEKKVTDFLGKHKDHIGKPREHWHPFDRKSGTGQDRTSPKRGHGKASWGDLEDELHLGGAPSTKNEIPEFKPDLKLNLEEEPSKSVNPNVDIPQE